MAITTLDAALSGMQPTMPFAKATTPTLVAGRPHSLWYLAGGPGTGLVPSVSTAGGVALNGGPNLSNNIAGQIPRVDPGSGNAYLGRLTGMATQPGLLLLCDRLLHCGAVQAGTTIVVTATTVQSITTVALPARDISGSTSGVGVVAALEVAANMGSASGTATISYVNSAGTSGHSSVNIDTVTGSPVLGAFHRFGLQAGDAGISSITSLTLSNTWTSGSLALVLYRVLAALELVGAYIPNAIDALTAGFPQLFNGTVPFLVFIPNTTTASFVSGTYTETQG